MESAEKEPHLYDYIVVNDDLDKAAEQLKVIAEAALRGETGRNVDIKV